MRRTFIKEELKVRTQLFGVSLLFFLILITIDLAYFLSQRLSLRWAWIALARSTFYAYLGDIKLYQDRDRRSDKVEVVGQKPRVGIRRRMVRGLYHMALEVEAGRLDGYYLIAHSLGTVVAWNRLMLPDALLARYLSQEEWQALPARFKKQSAAGLHDCCDPRRPPWLAPGDTVDRGALLSGLRGFMTRGPCPTDGSLLRPLKYYWDALLCYSGWILGSGVLIVGVMSVLNWGRETFTKAGVQPPTD